MRAALVSDRLNPRAKRWLAAGIFTLAFAGAALAQAAGDVESIDRRASDLLQAGKRTEAARVAGEALEIVEQRDGREHPDLAVRLDALADMYRIERRYAEAEQLLRRALAIREATFGQNAREIGRSLGILALTYDMQGRASEAEPLLMRALAIREAALGPQHPAVGQTLYEIARLNRKLRRMDEAAEVFERAVEVLGPGHPESILQAIQAKDFGAAATLLRISGVSSGDPEAAVRRSFFGQVTELRWTGVRVDDDANPQGVAIAGEAVHGNSIWQPFEVLMVRQDGDWQMRSIRILPGAWK